MPYAGWENERAAWGWLGRPPECVIQARSQVWDQWELLAKRAEKVAKMKDPAYREDQAKRVERDRDALIEKAQQWLAKQREAQHGPLFG